MMICNDNHTLVLINKFVLDTLNRRFRLIKESGWLMNNLKTFVKKNGTKVLSMFN